MATCGHHGRKTHPLYRAWRTLQTGADLLPDKQHAQLQALFAVDAHAEIEAIGASTSAVIAAHRQPDRTGDRTLMNAVIKSVSRGDPAALTDISPSARH